MKVRIHLAQVIAATVLTGSALAFLLARPARVGSAAPSPSIEENPALRDAAIALLALAQAVRPACDARDPDCHVRLSPFSLLVAQNARHYLVHRAPGFRDDCSGFVSAVFTASGVPMDGYVLSLWDIAVERDALHWEPVPLVGDLVFFGNTYDRDRDGLWDDEWTHIGVVLDVEPDATVVFAHAGTRSGRTLGRLNLYDPHVYKDPDGRVINSYLREPERWDPSTASYLAGELWVAFATVDPEDNWLEP